MILLDIEGTVAPVEFVFDVMFPWARTRVAEYLNANWESPETATAVDLIAVDMGFSGAEAWFQADQTETAAARQSLVVAAVHSLMDRDAKVTGLKQLQGLVWKSGFESGQLVATLFADVPERLESWHQSGHRLCVYSSGSVAAQKLFFGHTDHGNLLRLFSGFFDTTSGSKRQSASYSAIADQLQVPAGSVCFISDVVEELDAARLAGCLTIFRGSTDNADHRHPAIQGFDEIQLAGNTAPR